MTDLPTEIFTGLWIGTYKILENNDWLQKKKINTILNCRKYFENSSDDIDSNYYHLDKVMKFCEKCFYTIYSDLVDKQNNVLLVCSTGTRISVVAIFYFMKKCTELNKERIIEIILSKKDMILEPFILNILNKL